VGTAETVAAQTATRTCIVASTPWSGSRKLAQVLRRSGAMRPPRAWFDPVAVPLRSRQLGLSIGDPAWSRRYLEAVRARATLAGTCSLLVMWTHLRWMVHIARSAPDGPPDGHPQLDTDVVAAWFPQPQYVWLRSRETGSQALRWYLSRRPDMLESSPMHESSQKYEGRPTADWQEVRWLETMLERYDRGWNTFFTIHGVQPTTVFYEDLRERTPESATAVLDDLGMEGNEPTDGPVFAEGRVDALADRLADEYRRARSRLCATVGVRAVNA
jgi:LPS sulfotransferase NodH